MLTILHQFSEVHVFYIFTCLLRHLRVCYELRTWPNSYQLTSITQLVEHWTRVLTARLESRSSLILRRVFRSKLLELRITAMIIHVFKPFLGSISVALSCPGLSPSGRSAYSFSEQRLVWSSLNRVFLRRSNHLHTVFFWFLQRNNDFPAKWMFLFTHKTEVVKGAYVFSVNKISVEVEALNC